MELTGFAFLLAAGVAAAVLGTVLPETLLLGLFVIFGKRQANLAVLV